MMIQLMALIIIFTSVVVAGVLIGVLSIQQVYAHNVVVKRLFIECFIAFLGADLLLFVRRFIVLDRVSASLVVRGILSLGYFALITVGCAATILYINPVSGSWREMLSEIMRKMGLPFITYMMVLVITLILAWTLPIELELKGGVFSEIGLYRPILEPPRLIVNSIVFAAFLAYPTRVFLLASNAAENSEVSESLKIFATCMVGLAVYTFLQPFFLSRWFAEAGDIIRIPCLIIMTYLFRKITTLQSFYDVDLREYIESLKRRRGGRAL